MTEYVVVGVIGLVLTVLMIAVVALANALTPVCPFCGSNCIEIDKIPFIYYGIGKGYRHYCVMCEKSWIK